MKKWAIKSNAKPIDNYSINNDDKEQHDGIVSIQVYMLKDKILGSNAINNFDLGEYTHLHMGG